ncbi:hypothetical protein RFI_39338 [Reticulomyxa filosa]|uniref:Uncharacterized protein n=1 Tax=Reticulomyxa filosa TaxID=46433 RepID=X6LAL0_RETFI|nr:hypothetical protein RFI_39338 [Reticulomyxa filosa]|eukprot:ETN98176.1 hypothetical protein RFI_39338 [Reticulomyxa filosa]
MQISAIWNHSIDFNLIYVAIKYKSKGYINKAIELLLEFEQWKFQDNNEQNYKKRINEFLERRCCNHNVNLFCIFLSKKYKDRTAFEHAVVNIAVNGLPFVRKNRKTK